MTEPTPTTEVTVETPAHLTTTVEVPAEPVVETTTTVTQGAVPTEAEPVHED